jgi:hypothetical protein
MPYPSRLVVYCDAFYHGSVIETIQGQKVDDVYMNAIRKSSSDAGSSFVAGISRLRLAPSIRHMWSHDFPFPCKR